MNEETRGTLTIALWFLSALVLIALFVSAAAQGELTLVHGVFAAVLLGLAVIGTTVLWRGAVSESGPAKAKRQRVDRLLHELSLEELIDLKQRLADEDLSEETTIEFLGDDGELVRRR